MATLLSRHAALITTAVFALALGGCDTLAPSEPIPPDVGGSFQMGAADAGAVQDAPIGTFQSPEPQASAQFGRAVADVGGNVLVGTPNHDADGATSAGEAHLFTPEGALLATLRSPEPLANGRFGWTVAATSDLVAVGEPTRTVDGRANAGRVYLFGPDGTYLRTLDNPEPRAFVQFGRSVGIAGETVVVGALNPADGQSNAGKAYLFASDGTHLETLQSPEPQAFARFGWAVAGVGENVLVGEPTRTVDGRSNAGQAYLFGPDGTLLATLQASNPEAGSLFGWSVAGVGENALVGAVARSAGEESSAGQAFLFSPDGSVLATFESPEPQAFAQFGWAVGAVGEHVLVGANRHDVGESSNAGQAYVFAPDGTHVTTFQSPTLASGFTGFGASVAGVAGDVVIGAPTHDVGEESSAGLAYLYAFGAEGGNPEEPDSARAIDRLIAELDALAAAGRLRPEHHDALAAQVYAALESLEADRARPACNQLGAFVNHVRALVRSRRLSEADAEVLVELAEEAREELCVG